MLKELTIELEARDGHLTVTSLTEALERALVFLRGLQDGGEWEVVKVSKRSPFKLVVRNPTADKFVPDYLNQMRAARSKIPPELHLPDSAIVGTRELMRTLKDGISNIKLSYTGEKSVKLTPRVVKAVRSAYRSVSKQFVEWTTIRGMLEQITVSGGRHEFRLREQLSGAYIKCGFSPELLNKVKDGLPHRVEIYGKANTSRIKGVTFIEALEVRVLPDKVRRLDELPPVEISGKLSSEEFLERIRGDDD